MTIPEPNPRRLGACSYCGNYRLDGRPPYLHNPGCPREGELQIDRYLAELASEDANGPTLYETEADAARAREVGVREAVTYVDLGLLPPLP